MRLKSPVRLLSRSDTLGLLLSFPFSFLAARDMPGH